MAFREVAKFPGNQAPISFSVGSDGSVFCIGGDKRAYSLALGANDVPFWQPLTMNGLVDIAAGHSQLVGGRMPMYAGRLIHLLYILDHGNLRFVMPPGSSDWVHFDIGANGEIFAIASDQKSYEILPNNSVEVLSDVALEDITVGNSNNLWGCANSKTYRYGKSASDAYIAAIIAGTSSSFPEEEMWEYGFSQSSSLAGIKQISAGVQDRSSRAVWATTSSKGLFEYAGSRRTGYRCRRERRHTVCPETV